MRKFSVLACLVALFLFAGSGQASGRILRTILRGFAPPAVVVAPPPVYPVPFQQLQGIQGYGGCGVQGLGSGIYGGQSFQQFQRFQGQRFRRGGARFIRINGQLFRVR